LALVQETARGHGGRVEVVGEPGEGAEFRLHVPLAPADAEALA
jgi:signal transduction histidine kinase